MLDFSFEVLLYLLCFKGFWAETHVRIILLAHIGLIMRMQGCSCVCMNLPRNLHFYLSVFASAFTCILLFSLFSIFLCFQSFCFTCLIACLLSHVRIRVYFMLFYFDVMNMHSHAYA